MAAGGDHAIADLEISDPRADALDHAGHFRRRREREGRLDLVLALDHQDVEEVQRRRLDRNHGLAGPRHGIGHVGQHEIVGLAILRAEDGFHGHTFGKLEAESFLPDLQPGYNPERMHATWHKDGRREGPNNV